MINLVTIELQCAKIHLSKAPAFFFFELYSTMAFLRKGKDHVFLVFSLNVNFLDEEGHVRKLGDIVRYKRSWGHKLIWDAGKHCYRKTGVFAMPVRHAAYAGQL